MADGGGSPARERPASRQRANTPAGRAAKGESAPVEDDEDLRADERWHTKVNVPRVNIGESFDISEGGKSYSFTKRATKEWSCGGTPGCTKIIGIKIEKKDSVEMSVPVGNIGRQQFLQHTRVRNDLVRVTSNHTHWPYFPALFRSQTCADNIAKAAGGISRGRGRPPGHGRGRGRGGRGSAESGGAGGGRAAPAAAAATAPAPAREVGAWEDGRQITANVLFEEGELQITRTFTFTECMGLNKKMGLPRVLAADQKKSGLRPPKRTRPQLRLVVRCGLLGHVVCLGQNIPFGSFWLAISEPGWVARNKVPIEVWLRSAGWGRSFLSAVESR